VLRQRLSLQLLAPTVVVSLILVALCSAGALYINHLHVDISRVFAEHVASTLAAQRLEITIDEMVKLLRGRRNGTGLHMGALKESHDLVLDQLEEAKKLANLERESELVGEISAGLDTYFEKWEQRGQPVLDGALADLLETSALEPCRQLHRFNTDQMRASEQNNERIIQRLTWALVAAGIAAPLSGLLLGYGVARGLYRSIYELGVRIRDAANRLSSDIPPVASPEPRDLRDLHQQMQAVLEQIEHVVKRLHHSERAALRSEQLAAVGQVAAGVAHELRNPLTSVKMLVQTGLEGSTPTGLPPEDLTIIEKEIARMEACIQTFLDFARPPTCERRRADLLDVTRRALALVEGRARRQQVAWSLDFPPHAVELLIDAEQIHQVLVNLLLNALDALPQGGTIRVEVDDHRTRAQPPQVIVRIHDSGPGIAPRIQERLFQPFVSGKETGLGLGLSICQRLVEAHGGTIDGTNAPAGGAVFTFTLPG
jgi:signal transduction histidine kinase